MDDKTFINEDILKRVLKKLDDLKDQSQEAVQVDDRLLTSLLKQLGWSPKAHC